MDLRASRNRHGRGVRGPVFAHKLPRHRTRSREFDQAVLEAYAPLQMSFPQELENLDLAVDTVPRMRLNVDLSVLPDEIAADGPVPLGRVIPAGIDRYGNATRSRLVIFRKPIEQRSTSKEERESLLRTVLATLVASHLGMSPEDVDPTLDW